MSYPIAVGSAEGLAMKDMFYTANTGRSDLTYRIAVTAAGADALKAKVL
ncbi:hypothetical protein [Paenibacillus sp. NRS-1781]